ncbi:MAG: hypothetical protein M8866_09835 [marine benthic group bacterium]|nr:hypothetical protein [Candidatus Benthicola marisminoris]
MNRRLALLRICVAVVALTTGHLLAAPASAQLCSGSGRYTVRLQPGLLVFPTPTPDDFAAGSIEHGPVVLNVRPRGRANNRWVVCLRADSSDMGNGKPISDLQYRRDDQTAWTPMSPGDQLLAQGNRGTRITLQFRILLDEATDPAGTYSADYTATAARQ